MESLGAGVKSVLVVDDEPAVSEVCLRILNSEGFEVDIANNGKIAQDMMRKRQYDLYLIDIRTPTMNGNELYQWLRKQHPQLVNRVIFNTGDVMDRDTMTFVEQTGRPLLAKPFSPDELKSVVRKTLGKAT